MNMAKQLFEDISSIKHGDFPASHVTLKGEVSFPSDHVLLLWREDILVFNQAVQNSPIILSGPFGSLQRHTVILQEGAHTIGPGITPNNYDVDTEMFGHSNQDPGLPNLHCKGVSIKT